MIYYLNKVTQQKKLLNSCRKNIKPKWHHPNLHDMHHSLSFIALIWLTGVDSICRRRKFSLDSNPNLCAEIGSFFTSGKKFPKCSYLSTRSARPGRAKTPAALSSSSPFSLLKPSLLWGPDKGPEGVKGKILLLLPPCTSPTNCHIAAHVTVELF